MTVQLSGTLWHCESSVLFARKEDPVDAGNGIVLYTLITIGGPAFNHNV